MKIPRRHLTVMITLLQLLSVLLVILDAAGTYAVLEIAMFLAVIILVYLRSVWYRPAHPRLKLTDIYDQK